MFGSGSLASIGYLRYGNYCLGSRMSKRGRAVGRSADGRHRCARTPSRSLAAVAIGGAGLVLAVPAAAFLVTPGRAQAAPLCVPPTVICNVSAAASPVVASIFGTAFGAADPLLDIAGQIPIINIFIGNGAAGTALHPDGGNAGILFGDGGAGFSPTTAGTAGGNGGSAGFFGNGGSGGTGGPGGFSPLGAPI
ncbi:MAG: hypothetical protein QOE89_857, partial [Pseudonocardiales bacterium]|nr:hypothetical protein [Pseudonocardiales bacterium]